MLELSWIEELWDYYLTNVRNYPEHVMLRNIINQKFKTANFWSSVKRSTQSLSSRVYKVKNWQKPFCYDLKLFYELIIGFI